MPGKAKDFTTEYTEGTEVRHEKFISVPSVYSVVKRS